MLLKIDPAADCNSPSGPNPRFCPTARMSQMPIATPRSCLTPPATTLAEFSVNFAVGKPIGTELLERVAASEAIARKLHAIQDAKWPVQFAHVIQAAQPFVGATIAHTWFGLQADNRQSANSTIWILCPSVHSQESFYESLVNWQSDALFLPEAEFAAAENILPHPEMVAERLAVLLQIERGIGGRAVVATRASLDQAAASRDTLQSALTQLRRGATADMEELLNRLITAGYERVAQVTTRGQFAVRGGIVDLYSWQAPLPLRLEFFG